MCPSIVADHHNRGFIIPIGGAERREKKPVILQRFVDLSGGPDSHIVIVPTASRADETGPNYIKVFENLGVENVEYLPITSREDCQNQAYAESLDRATGIFLTGGNQLRLSTILGGTVIAQSIRKRNAEGVPVAGTSAGASIMSEHMIASGEGNKTPKSDGVNLAPGLGLSNAAIIDQHFTQRTRLGRLFSATSYNPFLLGIGIDEDTAAFIGPDDMFEVVGSGSITIVDASNLTYSSMWQAGKGEALSLLGLKVDLLAKGCRYNISTRQAFAP